MSTEIILYKISDLPELIDFTKLYYKVDKKVRVNVVADSDKLISILNKSKNVVIIFQSLIASDLNFILKTLNDYRERNILQTCISICLIKSKNSTILSLLDKNKCNLALSMPKDPQELTNSINELLPVDQDQEQLSIDSDNLINILNVPPEVSVESGKISAELEHIYDDESIVYFSEFMDLFNNSVFLKLTNETDLSYGVLLLSLTLEYEGDKITIEDKVSIESVEPFDNQFEIVEFKVGKDGIHAIKEFHKLITKRQSNINVFLSKARGW